jgi:hypothetical protein
VSDETKDEIDRALGSLPDETLKQIAMDFVDNKIFSTAQMDASDFVVGIFVPLALFQNASGWLQDAALVFEYYAKAGPICINGMPTFLSCRKIVLHDWPSFQHYVREYSKLKEQFKVSKPPEHITAIERKP